MAPPASSPLSPNGLLPWSRPQALSAAAALTATLTLILSLPLARTLLLFAALPLVALAACHLLFNPLERWRYRHVPGFPYRPPLGNLPDIVRAGGMPHFALIGAEIYGPSFKFWRGTVCQVVTVDGPAAKKLGNRFSARGMGPKVAGGGGNGGGSVGDPLGLGLANPKATGLLLADGERFTRLKRAWQPAFAPSSLKAYRPLMRRAVSDAVARLQAEAAEAGSGSGAKAAAVDVHRVLAGMTMAVVGSCAFGVDWSALSSSSDEEGKEVVAGGSSSSKSSSGAGSEDENDARNNGGGSDDGDDNNDKNRESADRELEQREWRRMGRMLTHAAEDTFGATRLSAASKWAVLAMAAPWLAPIARFLGRRFPDAQLVRRVDARQRLDAASRYLVEQHARQHQQREAAAPAPSAPTRGRGVAGIAPGSLIACLTRDGAGLTTDDVCQQAQTFMLAGYETTLSALSLAVALLARHPEQQRALQRAIDEADAKRSAGGNADNLDEDDADDPDACIPYANAVLDEAMRLYPPGTAIVRSPAVAGAKRGDPALMLPTRGGRYVEVPPSVPAIHGVLYAIHRDPDVWGPTADQFVPERWLGSAGAAGAGKGGAMAGELSSERLSVFSGKAAAAEGTPLPPPPAASFLPFGCGARQCIGYRFALLEARTALVALFREMEFEAATAPGGEEPAAGAAPPPIKTATGITMGPDGGVWCVVRPRRERGVGGL